MVHEVSYKVKIYIVRAQKDKGINNGTHQRANNFHESLDPYKNKKGKTSVWFCANRFHFSYYFSFCTIQI